jgi:hypothetical protein
VHNITRVLGLGSPFLPRQCNSYFLPSLILKYKPCRTVSLLVCYLEALVAHEILHGVRYVVQHSSFERELDALKVRCHFEINNQFSVVFIL